MQRENNANKLE
jgi:hypothetical protein